jgi:hypothetical protein
MKFKPHLATVHDADDSDSPILHTRISSTRIEKNWTISTYKTKSKPESDITSECIFGESICRGSIREFVQSCAQPNGTSLTIFTRSQDTNSEQNELSGYRYRKVVVSGMPFV